MTSEARLEVQGSGLAPLTDGWFVVNLRDAAWETNEHFGAACFFESERVTFADLGMSVRVLSAGSRWLYHAEAGQEDFLVLAGECLLLVEGEERRLRAWDFVHCPPRTAHAFVATGGAPCLVVIADARGADWPAIVYPRSELALRHRSGVEMETTSPAEALAALPEWRAGRPADWNELPWSTDGQARPQGTAASADHG